MTVLGKGPGADPHLTFRASGLDNGKEISAIRAVRKDFNRIARDDYQPK